MIGAPGPDFPNIRCISAWVRGSSVSPAVSSSGRCVDAADVGGRSGRGRRLTSARRGSPGSGRSLVTVGQRAWVAAMASAIGSAPLIRLTDVARARAGTSGTPAVLADGRRVPPAARADADGLHALAGA